MIIDKTELRDILNRHNKWLMRKDGGEKADLRGTDLRGANLSGTDLRNADLSGTDLRNADLSGTDLRRTDLHGANLHGTDLSGTDLSGTDLRNADLSGTDLRLADLHGTDLRNADLSGTDLRRTDLHGANLDFACWPLWCGGLHVKTDRKIMAQLAYHFCAQDCDDPDYLKARNAILDFANTFHRVDECGVLKPIKYLEEMQIDGKKNADNQTQAG